jgi:hypothetical protein
MSVSNLLSEPASVAVVLANWATVIGVWVAILSYWREKRRERREREYGTYDALDEKYAEYLSLCAARPELDLYVRPLEPAPLLNNMQQIAQLAYFEVLVSLFERAYLMYKDHPTTVRAAQWKGWESYIRQWIQRKLFQKLWGEVGVEQFDSRFVRFVNDAIARKSSGLRNPDSEARSKSERALE